MKVRKLPKSVEIPRTFLQYGIGYDRDVYHEVQEHHSELVAEDLGDAHPYGNSTGIQVKLKMLTYIKEYLKGEGLDFDEFNGLAPTRINKYKGYEFTAVWVWANIVYFLQKHEQPKETWYKKYGACVASVMKKYPKITGFLISCADLHLPGNQLLDISKMEDADFDADHTDEFVDDEKANEFKAWILEWCNRATDKDKMRVRNWFQTKKSHKQIFAEINKVVGNSCKFNARLALFVERLFNQEGLDYFFEKTGFDSKEDLFMAYFDKLTQFDEETKKSFIKKYLLG